MRSFAEISFRARQEAANLYLLGTRPRFSGEAPGALSLPDPRRTANALVDSEYATEVIALADQVLDHHFPLLAVEVETGPEIQWRRDYR